MHSFPSRLPPLSYGTTCNLLLFLCYVDSPAFGEISQSLLDLCLLNFVSSFFLFCKNISTTICWVVSGNCFILLFSFVCVFLFLQYRLVQWHCLHNTKVCFFVGCVCVLENFPSCNFHILLPLSFYFVCLKTAAYVLKDIHNFPHLIFS